MAFIISDDCVSCGTCAESCPTDSILAGIAHMEIDIDTCVECGACAEGCFVGAIHSA